MSKYEKYEWFLIIPLFILAGLIFFILFLSVLYPGLFQEFFVMSFGVIDFFAMFLIVTLYYIFDKRRNNKGFRAFKLLKKGRILKNEGKYTKALNTLKKALKKIHNTDTEPIFKINLLNTMGLIYHKIGLEQSSIESLNQAKQVYQDNSVNDANLLRVIDENLEKITKLIKNG